MLTPPSQLSKADAHQAALNAQVAAAAAKVAELDRTCTALAARARDADVQSERAAAHLDQVESEAETTRRAKFAAEDELQQLMETYGKLNVTVSVLKVRGGGNSPWDFPAGERLLPALCP